MPEHLNGYVSPSDFGTPAGPSLDVPVMVVGGGPVGLTTSLLLARKGVQALLVERHPGTSIHPRARGINIRTMEIFRGLGLESAIRRAGEALAGSRYLLWVETLAGTELRRVSTWDEQDAQAGGVDTLSPTNWASCAQDDLEPTLLAEARRWGVDVRFDVTCEHVEQDADGVTATLVDRKSGQRSSVRARYMVAADGGRSGIRSALGIGTSGPGSLTRNVSIYFRADLRAQTEHRQFILCFVEHPAIRGLILSVNQSDRWILMAPDDPALQTSMADLTPERCVELIRTATGLPDLGIEILSVLPWEARAEVADRFQQGRVFLAGDAAHLMPPSGAFGMNTGLQDAHNLAWKLAAVLTGAAGPGLLTSYDQERRPAAVVTIEHAIQVGAQRFNHERAGKNLVGAGGRPRKAAPPVPAVDDLAVMLGYWYRSSAVAGGPPEAPTLALLGRTGLALDGRPGTRAPHAWVQHNGERRSTVDLFDGHWTLLAAEQGVDWVRAVQDAASARGLPLTAYRLGADVEPIDGAAAVEAMFGIGPAGAVLVRPDGFVGWRRGSGEGADASRLGTVLDRLLARE